MISTGAVGMDRQGACHGDSEVKASPKQYRLKIEINC